MKRILWGMAACALTLATAQAQIGQPQPGEGPSVAHAIPLSYVGGSGRVSIGIDSDGDSTGEALGVFGNNGEHAYIGQLWWGHGGSGGVQLGYNWLWGGTTLSEAQQQPERVTVARTMAAVDQNAFKDRKATVGFGIERKDYFLDAYLSVAASGSHHAGARNTAADRVLEGSDAVGTWTQVETVTTTTGFARQAYDGGLGLRGGHFSDPLALRLYGGVDYQRGRAGAHVFTLSAGADKYLGQRGWSLSGLVEHDESSTDPFHGGSSDTRASLFLRYEFGGRVFAPTSELSSPAWIARALVNPTSGHPRVVKTYTRRTSTTTTTEVGPKHYTNHNPVALDDAATALADAGETWIDVLANDSDADGDPLTLVAVSAAEHGSAAIAGTQVSYTPAAGYIGADRFSYTISDGRGGSASAHVAVSVAARPNQAPIARDDVASTEAARPVTIDLLANDNDPDGDPLVVTALTQPAHGSAELGGDGRVTYTPAASFSGTDRFGYTIEDGRGGRASANVTVTVAPPPNRAPLARDDVAGTPAGTPVTIVVLANDSDPDGDPLRVTALGSPAHGSAQLNGDDTVTYTPDGLFTGTDRFSYTIEDGRGGRASATVQVRVDPPPNRPPVANDDSAVVPYGGSVTLDVLANDSDPDGDPLDVVAVTQGAYGSVAILPDHRVSYTVTDPVNGGTDRFTYTVSDGRGGSASASVTITQAPRGNQPPVANDDSALVPYGGSATIDVLANDSDPDGDPLVVVAVSQGAYGSVAILPDHRISYTVTDPLNGSTTDRFTYTISDGRGGSASASVTITQAPRPNQPPVANDDSALVPYGGSVTIDVLANDSDPDGDPLDVVAVTQGAYGQVAILPDHRVSYSWTAAAPGGTDQFTYTIGDGRGGSASATVSVTHEPPPNRPPVANDDSATVPHDGGTLVIPVLDNDSDPDGDPLSVISTGPAQFGDVTILASGDLAYVRHATAPPLPDAFTYTISDGRGGTASATVTVLPPPNQPPIARDDKASVEWNGAPQVLIDVLANDSDPDGDALRIVDVTQPAAGQVSIAGDQLAYVATEFGDFTFSYTIDDGHGGVATATVTVHVAPPP